MVLKGEIAEVVERFKETREQKGLGDRGSGSDRSVAIAEQVTVPNPAEVAREAPQVDNAAVSAVAHVHAGVSAPDGVRGLILILSS